MGTDGNYSNHGEHFIRHIIVESLFCTPEMNIVFYVKYSSKKKSKKEQGFENNLPFILIAEFYRRKLSC